MAADAATRKKDGEAIAVSISKDFDSDIFILNSSIEPGLDTKIIGSVIKRNKRKNIIVFLVTEGGSADVAYRIARTFQNFYAKVTIVVAGWCKSAGTLICVGANELIIGEFGELGPLDVQLAKPDELGLIASGLTIDSSFRSLQAAAFQMFERCLLDILSKSGGRITTKTAAELAVSLSVGLFSPIYQQMDPAKIGEDYRSTRIAEEYALRLGVLSQNLATDGVESIEMLVRGYPSHGFVIDRSEAENLFNKVLPLEGKLLSLATLLGATVVKPRTPEIVCYLGPEVENEEDSKAGETPDVATGSEDAKQEREQQIQEDFIEGDGIVPLPLAKRQARANGKNQNSK